MSDEAARTFAFIALVAANLALIFVSRSGSASLRTLLGRSNAVFWWIAAGAGGALMLAIYVAPAAAIFQFAAPPAPVVALAVAGAMAAVLIAGSALRNVTPLR